MNTPARTGWVRDHRNQKSMVEDVNALKIKGNEAFSREDYGVALDFYSKAIDGVKATVPKNESEFLVLAFLPEMHA
jgi:hypothetical protein